MADFLVHTREMLPIEASPEVLEAERLLSLLKAHCETHGLSAVAMVAPSRETLEHFAMDGPPVGSVTVRTGPVAACVFLAGTLLMGVKERLDEARGGARG